MPIRPWPEVVRRLNELEPDANPPYTEALCWQIVCRAFRKIRRRYPELARQIMDTLRDTPPTLPLANVIMTNKHKHFAMVGFDPTYSSTESDFSDLDFSNTVDKAAAIDKEEPEPGPTLPTEMVKALDKSCQYWRQKLEQPVIEVLE